MTVYYERPQGDDKDKEHLIENSSGSADNVNDTDLDGIPATISTSSMMQPEFFEQSKLNDFVQDLGLSKKLVKLLASRLSEKHVFKPGTNVSFYQHRDKEFRRHFREDGGFVTCK